MHAWEIASLVSAGLACFVWALLIARVDRATNAMAKLPTSRLVDEARPNVSVVLAARDEADAIEHTVRSLLGQDGVEVEVIAVDDGSEDGTLDILRDLEKGEPRLTVLENTKLPKGWVAKTYALELGQGRASGEFLLFTDADVTHGKRAIAHAIQVMEEEQLDHLAVHPRLEAGSFLEAMVLPLYFVLCEFRFIDKRAADPASRVGAGIGAFNLVRAESYRLRGTHARIRGAVLDDRALGRMMRFDGGRGSVRRAVSQVRMRPYRSFSALYRGMKKGALSALGNSAWLTTLFGLGLMLLGFAPLALVLAGIVTFSFGGHGWAAVPAALALIVPSVGLLRARSLVRFEPLASLLYPLGALVIAMAALHAGVHFGATGHITWRGRRYSRRSLQESLSEMK